MLTAFFSVGVHQCDEIYQVYEFAGYKLGINQASELPWEFHEQMRSGIQPFCVYVITKALHALSIENPFTISCFIRTLQSLFSFLVLLQFLGLMEKEIRSKTMQAWLYGFGLLFWCLPYFHARFNSENFSATLFLLGLVLILRSIERPNRLIPFLLAGLCMGIAFECRFQTSFMIAGLFGWLLVIKRASFSAVAIAILGVVLSVGLGLIADHWLYDKWVLSWWNYVDLNLFKDKASQFGREPVYFFVLESLLQLIPPFSLLIIYFVIAFWVRFRTHVLTWITLPFILLHFFVAHKELRFLFPVLNFLPVMILLYVQSVQSKPGRLTGLLRSSFFVKFSITVNVLLLVFFIFKPADNASFELRKIYSLTGKHPLDLWYKDIDPYSDHGSLHYFRNPAITTISDTLKVIPKPNTCYYTPDFSGPDVLAKNNTVFVKQYSSFPAWFSYLNFNGWVERSDPFTIYKKYQPSL